MSQRTAAGGAECVGFGVTGFKFRGHRLSLKEVTQFWRPEYTRF